MASSDMENPQFSIVIPVYNGANFIASAMDSVLAQGYKDFNLIVLENHSSDATIDIVSGYKDKRIILVTSQRTLSIEENWARILDLELNDYLTILSHDDLFHPDFLDKMSTLIQDMPQASVYQSHFYLIDEKGQKIRCCQPIPKVESGEEFLHALHRFERDSFGTGYVVRSSDYKQMGGFPPLPRLLYADDYTWYKLASLSYKVCHPEHLFSYRIHMSSASNTMDLDTLNIASQRFVQLLSGSDYFEDRSNLYGALHYVWKSFVEWYRRTLKDLISQDQQNSLEETLATKCRLQDFIRHYGASPDLGKIGHFYEWAAQIPRRDIRRILSLLISIGAGIYGRARRSVRALK